MRPRDEPERKRNPIWLIGMCFYSLLGSALMGVGLGKDSFPLVLMGAGCLFAAGWMTRMDMRSTR